MFTIKLNLSLLFSFFFVGYGEQSAGYMFVYVKFVSGLVLIGQILTGLPAGSHGEY